MTYVAVKTESTTGNYVLHPIYHAGVPGPVSDRVYVSRCGRKSCRVPGYYGLDRNDPPILFADLGDAEQCKRCLKAIANDPPKEQSQ